jgi:hypothetical protein
MNINKGEVLVLDNGKEYLVVDTIVCHATEYAFLTTTSKPLEILIGKKVDDGNGNSYIDKVNDVEEIRYILSVLLDKKEGTTN